MIEPKNELKVQWDDFAGPDNQYDLIAIYEYVYRESADENVQRYLRSIQEIRPVKSRQVAAVAIINARAFQALLMMPQ